MIIQQSISESFKVNCSSLDCYFHYQYYYYYNSTSSSSSDLEEQKTLVLFCLNLAVVKLGFQFLVVENLPSSFHEILLQNVVSIRPNGKESSLCTNVSHIGPV